MLSLVASPLYASEFGNGWFTLEPYRPTFLLLGRPDTKVQFSAKVRIVPSMPLYLGYSQLMKWELFLPSAPFRDVNFEPEIFYRWSLSENAEAPGRLGNDESPPSSFIDWGLFAHESNGRDGADSRAWDRVSLRAVTGWRVGDRANLHVSIKLHVPVRLDVTNRDLLRFRGLFEAEVVWARFLDASFEESELRLRVFTGGAWYVSPWSGGQELTLRLKPKATTYLPTFVAQVFHGYGENLLDYDRRRFVVRVGLGF